MKAKALEIRDTGTFIPALAVDMSSENEGQRYLLRRCGYALDGRPNIILTRLDGNGTATNDPYDHDGKGRTWAVAHSYIITHWAELEDGDVVDVEFILGETSEAKQNERYTFPLLRTD